MGTSETTVRVVPTVWTCLARSPGGLRAHYAACSDAGEVLEVACHNQSGSWVTVETGETLRLCQSCVRLVEPENVANVEPVGMFSVRAVSECQ